MLLFFGLQVVLTTRALASAQDCSLDMTLDAPKSPMESEFSSPRYPRGFPINKTCGWYIKAPKDYIIELRFTSEEFLFNSVSVFDVFDKEGTDRIPINLVRFYNSKIISRSRLVYILFTNNETYAIMRQLKVRYKAFKPGRFCSSSNSIEENTNILLRNPSGIINTPGFPKDYTDSSVHDCFWKLVAPQGKLVRVRFLTFQIHINDRVRISDDWNWWLPWYIDRRTPWHSFTVYSTGRQLGIKVYGHRTFGENRGAGFIANYTMVPAGDLLGTCVPSQNSTVLMSGEGRSFSSPRYPANPGVGTCSWNISVPQGEYVRLTFWRFQGSCDLNYAEVFDVTDTASKLLTKSCEDTLFNQQVLYSNGNNVIVRHFSLSDSDDNGGFTATYEAIKGRPARYACFDPVVVRLNRTHGEFASFDYPLPYPNSAQCSWFIDAPIGHVVRLTFHSFALQESQDCQSDYVDVKEGFNGVDIKLIGRFCGTSLPPVIQSKYPQMFVNFASDILKRYPGFHASYVFVHDPAVGPCNRDGVDNIIQMSGERGRLFSPRYPPFPRPRNISCTWIITVPQGQFVKLRVTRLEQESGCSLLSIHDGRAMSSPLVKSFCLWDVLPETYLSSGRYILVRFQSSSMYWWFTAEFEAVKQLPASYSCTRKARSAELTSKTGALASFNYPLSYPDMGSCDWKIEAGLFKRIELSFDVFNLSDPSPECSDYVQIGDDKMAYQWDSTTKFCGSQKPSPVTSDGGELYVWFWSSGETKHPGFKASYKIKVSPRGIGIIVASCLGAVLFVIIGICGFKYFKSWRKGASRDRSQRREDLYELCNDQLI